VGAGTRDGGYLAFCDVGGCDWEEEIEEEGKLIEDSREGEGILDWYMKRQSCRPVTLVFLRLLLQHLNA